MVCKVVLVRCCLLLSLGFKYACKMWRPFKWTFHVLFILLYKVVPTFESGWNPAMQPFKWILFSNTGSWQTKSTTFPMIVKWCPSIHGHQSIKVQSVVWITIFLTPAGSHSLFLLVYSHPSHIALLASGQTSPPQTTAQLPSHADFFSPFSSLRCLVPGFCAVYVMFCSE